MKTINILQVWLGECIFDCGSYSQVVLTKPDARYKVQAVIKVNPKNGDPGTVITQLIEPTRQYETR